MAATSDITDWIVLRLQHVIPLDLLPQYLD